MFGKNRRRPPPSRANSDSAVASTQLARDPWEVESQTRVQSTPIADSTSSNGGRNIRQRNSGSGRKGDNKRDSLTNCQMNSAVNRPSLARDPREEMKQEQKARRNNNNSGNNGSLSNVCEDGNDNSLPQSGSPPPGKCASPFANYKIEDDKGTRRLGANSAIGSTKSLIQDPRMEQDSFRRRTHDSGDRPPSTLRTSSENDVSFYLSSESVSISKLSASDRDKSFYTCSTDNKSEEEKPLTRPSAPGRQRRINRSNAFDTE